METNQTSLRRFPDRRELSPAPEEVENGKQTTKSRAKLRGKKCGTLHDFACHPCAGAMLIFSVSFQF